MSKSLFITFEGGEGSGKTTIIERVKTALEEKKKEVVTTREPGGVALGEAVRKIVLESSEPVAPIAELLLFLAARAQHVEEKIKPAINARKVVLCDRFTDSTLAYQGFARGLGIEALVPICRMAASSLEPDLTIYLDIAPEVGLERAKNARKEEKSDRIEIETIAFHQKVREGFLALAERSPTRIVTIDASQDLEKVVEQVMKQISEHVNALNS